MEEDSEIFSSTKSEKGITGQLCPFHLPAFANKYVHIYRYFRALYLHTASVIYLARFRFIARTNSNVYVHYLLTRVSYYTRRYTLTVLPFATRECIRAFDFVNERIAKACEIHNIIEASIRAPFQSLNDATIAFGKILFARVKNRL